MGMMAATQIDLKDAQTMDAARITEREGRWYLRRLSDDEWHVGLLSERAPAGTTWRDLKPGRVEIVCDNEDGVEIDAGQLAAFCRWPPDESGHGRLIDRIASMLWTFDGAENVRKEDAEREREAYRARARVLVRIFNESGPGVQQPHT